MDLFFINLFQQRQACWCDEHIGGALVVWTGGFRNHLFRSQAVKKARHIGIAVEHAALDLGS